MVAFLLLLLELPEQSSTNLPPKDKSRQVNMLGASFFWFRASYVLRLILQSSGMALHIQQGFDRSMSISAINKLLNCGDMVQVGWRTHHRLVRC